MAAMKVKTRSSIRTWTQIRAHKGGIESVVQLDEEESLLTCSSPRYLDDHQLIKRWRVHPTNIQWLRNYLHVHGDQRSVLKLMPLKDLNLSDPYRSCNNNNDTQKKDSRTHSHNKSRPTRSSSKSKSFVASSATDHIVKIWSVATGKCVRALVGHTSYVESMLRFSFETRTLGGPSVDVLITGAHDYSIKFWDIDNEMCIGSIETESKVFSICQLENGWIVSAQWCGKIKVWEFVIKEEEEEKEKQSCAHGRSQQQSASIDGGGRSKVRVESRMVRMIRAHNYICNRVVALNKGTLISPQPSSSSSVSTLSTSTPTASPLYFASCSEDKSVAIWDAMTGVCIRKLLGHQSDVKAMVQLRNGLLLTGSGDSTLIVWNLNEVENPIVDRLTISGLYERVTDPVELKDGSIVVGLGNGTIERWELRCNMTLVKLCCYDIASRATRKEAILRLIDQIPRELYTLCHDYYFAFHPLKQVVNHRVRH